MEHRKFFTSVFHQTSFKRGRKEILHTTSTLIELSISLQLLFLLQIEDCVVPLIFRQLTEHLFCLESVKIRNKLIKMRTFRGRQRAPRLFLLACIALQQTKITWTEIIHKLRLQTWQNNACYKTLINDLTFRMSQHTSSEVTVGENATRFKC